MGFTLPQPDAQDEASLYATVAGYSHRMYGAMKQRQRYVCALVEEGPRRDACAKFDNWWSASGQFVIPHAALAAKRPALLRSLGKFIWDDKDTRDKDLGYVQEATWPLVLMEW